MAIFERDIGFPLAVHKYRDGPVGLLSNFAILPRTMQRSRETAMQRKTFNFEVRANEYIDKSQLREVCECRFKIIQF